MNDQLIAMMEALRLCQHEIDQFRGNRKGGMAALNGIEKVLHDPVVQAAIGDSSHRTPSLVPESEVETDDALTDSLFAPHSMAR